jgi:hypothetical protein
MVRCDLYDSVVLASTTCADLCRAKIFRRRLSPFEALELRIVQYNSRAYKIASRIFDELDRWQDRR